MSWLFSSCKAAAILKKKSENCTVAAFSDYAAKIGKGQGTLPVFTRFGNQEMKQTYLKATTLFSHQVEMDLLSPSQTSEIVEGLSKKDLRHRDAFTLQRFVADRAEKCNHYFVVDWMPNCVKIERRNTLPCLSPDTASGLPGADNLSYEQQNMSNIEFVQLNKYQFQELQETSNQVAALLTREDRAISKMQLYFKKVKEYLFLLNVGEISFSERHSIKWVYLIPAQAGHQAKA